MTPSLSEELYPLGLAEVLQDVASGGNSGGSFGGPPVELLMMGRVPALAEGVLANQRAHTKADDEVLELKTRSALTLAVSVANGCHGCVRSHREHALQLGWSEADITAILGITAECSMLNTYHRHRELDESLKLPTHSGLTFKLLDHPPIERKVYELICVVVSGLNNCPACVRYHTDRARASGLSDEAIREAVRLGAVMTLLNLYFRVQ